MAGVVVSWVQLQNVIDKLKARCCGELDDFDEQELDDLSVEGKRKEECDWSSLVAGLAAQRKELVQARMLSWEREEVAREEVEYFDQLYWTEYCFGNL